jgi:hypothetical protein
MKLKKDEFKKSEIDAAANKIIDIFIEYTIANRLIANRVQNSTSINISSIDPHHYNYQTKIFDFKKFMKNEFQLFNADMMHPTHRLVLNDDDKLNFYLYALKKLNKFEKIILIKTNGDLKPKLKSLVNSNVLSEDDYWLQLRHVAPFTKFKQSAYTDHVREMLNTLLNKSIDTNEKVESLAYFLNYYKVIARRTDVKAGIIRLLKNKVNEEDYPIFESILSTKISKNNSELDIFLPTSEVKTLIISKSAIFEQVAFAQIPQAKVDHYNKYLQAVNHFLLSPETKKELNISRIDFHEFQSHSDPARIYISSENGGFKENIENIYKHLIQSCASLHMVGPSKLGNAFKTSLDYFLLNNSIQEANRDKNDNYEPKKKTLKL